ncbi:GNAT family N-acetyltransferase [Rikenella microfusus]|uniref:GNAT family N-acetyltransferase n=1 Tax=Rikenella microfusus TaxID=28139 RepID=UPI001DC7C96F|nr:GNAT family N-acetyltransferase [Rikenella microfusus]HJE88823.1 GNAT family N-acetyltransferase [Rikenella microfusus]
MEIELTPVTGTEYPRLVEIWEASVRATHHFLRPGDTEFYKARMPAYLRSVRLTAARDEAGRITAFLGTCDGSIEMLFVHPEERGRGIGKTLVRYAVGKLGCGRVDVNEQNGQAVGFYEKLGFRKTGWSPVDAEGRPYPILHLGLPGVVCGAAE